MSKKTSPKNKTKVKDKIEEPQSKLDEQLSSEEYEQMAVDLDEFQDSSFSFLAGTSQFEVVPTIDEEGEPLPKENLSLIKRECKRLGFTVLYSIENRNSILIINPDNMKLLLIPNQIEMQ